jgi:hypothetical protein
VAVTLEWVEAKIDAVNRDGCGGGTWFDADDAIMALEALRELLTDAKAAKANP